MRRCEIDFGIFDEGGRGWRHWGSMVGLTGHPGTGYEAGYDAVADRPSGSGRITRVLELTMGTKLKKNTRVVRIQLSL